MYFIDATDNTPFTRIESFCENVIGTYVLGERRLQYKLRTAFGEVGIADVALTPPLAQTALNLTRSSLTNSVSIDIKVFNPVTEDVSAMARYICSVLQPLLTEAATTLRYDQKNMNVAVSAYAEGIPDDSLYPELLKAIDTLDFNVLYTSAIVEKFDKPAIQIEVPVEFETRVLATHYCLPLKETLHALRVKNLKFSNPPITMVETDGFIADYMHDDIRSVNADILYPLVCSSIKGGFVNSYATGKKSSVVATLAMQLRDGFEHTQHFVLERCYNDSIVDPFMAYLDWYCADLKARLTEKPNPANAIVRENLPELFADLGNAIKSGIEGFQNNVGWYGDYIDIAQAVLKCYLTDQDGIGKHFNKLVEHYSKDRGVSLEEAEYAIFTDLAKLAGL